MKAVLVASGWDPSGAAGLAQDLKVLAALGVHGCGAPTALTSQGREGVRGVNPVDPALLAGQLAGLVAEQPLGAAKAGLLPGPGQVEALARALEKAPGLPLVLDPVFGASAGGSLVEPGLPKALRRGLLARVALLTPNLEEAAVLLGGERARDREGMAAQARALRALGPAAVLLKGGHLGGPDSPDCFSDAGGETFLEGGRVGGDRRGTGCALASAAAAFLALGEDLPSAARKAKAFVAEALERSKGGAPGEPLRFN